jgi:hypothetical protein
VAEGISNGEKIARLLWIKKAKKRAIILKIALSIQLFNRSFSASIFPFYLQAII